MTADGWEKQGAGPPRLADPAAPAAVSASIIVPTYREAGNLRPLVMRIARALAPAGQSFEIVVVDDNSQDGTDREVASLQADGYPVRLITRVAERGLSSAVVRGFQEANGAVLVCMDADLSHPPESLPALLQALQAPGVDFVIGSRYVPGASTDEDWGLFRRLNSKVATLLAYPFVGVRDPMAGFFALHRSTFASARALNPIGYKIGLELMVKCGCRTIREVPIHFADRKLGESKMNVREQLNYLRHLARLARFKLAKK